MAYEVFWMRGRFIIHCLVISNKHINAASPSAPRGNTVQATWKNPTQVAWTLHRQGGWGTMDLFPLLPQARKELYLYSFERG